MTNVRVRRATAKDAAAVVAITREAAAEPGLIVTRPHEVTDPTPRMADPLFAILVAERGGEVVGFLAARRGEREAQRHAAELGLNVAAAHRGTGVGEALMLAVEDWARGMGVRKLCLSVFATNERARGLYAKLGYAQEGLRERHYLVDGHFVDEVLMAKWVS